MFLPDINVWVAMTFDSHVHHPSAKLWFDGITDERIYFCRTSQLGFLRLATNRKVVGKHALTLQGAWRKYDVYLSDPRIKFATEPGGIEAILRGLTGTAIVAPNLWNDAYLAAFALAADYEMVTFDQGFRQFPGKQFRNDSRLLNPPRNSQPAAAKPRAAGKLLSSPRTF